MIDLLIILVSFGVSLALTVYVRKELLARAVLDTPNERSSHKEPVPRGGGWALLGLLLPGMIVTALVQRNFFNHTGIIAGVVLLAYVSWQDDRQGSGVLLRLCMHLFAALLGSLAFSHDRMIFGGFIPFWLDRALMIVGWAWFMNLYNFMDGIDGITCTETIAIATGTCIVLSSANINDPFTHALTLLIAGACIGFLALNWHPAKIFMGDIGSVPLGFLTGYLLLSIALNGHLIAAMILPLYYIVDSGITITKRALRGEKIWQAHRQHFYQQAAIGVGRHDKVVYWIALANFALIVSALISLAIPFLGFLSAMVIVAILLGKMHNYGTRSGY